MSWLARSIANTLRLEDDADDDDSHSVDLRDDDVCNPRYGAVDRASSVLLHPSECLDLEEVDLEDRLDVRNGNSDVKDYDDDRDCGGTDIYGYDEGRGVREDLSEFRETLTRQFWGVASFLAPPPPPPPPPPSRRNAGYVELDRERKDCSAAAGFEEEEDASDGQSGKAQRDFLELGEEEDEDLVGEAVGITEEVLAFAQNIAHHPETWLDFPFSEEEEEFDGK